MKKFSTHLLLLLLVSVPVNPSLCASMIQEESFAQLLQSAQTLVDNKKYKDAKKKLQKALKINKDSADAHLLMAFVLRHENKRKETIKHIYQAIQIQPERADSHYYLAVLLYETNEPAQAEAELDKSIQLGLHSFNSYTLKGDLAIGDQNYKLALENYEKALQFKTRNQERFEEIRVQAEALKNYVTFRERKDKASYTTPKPLNRPRPNYSEDARNNNIQGIVQVLAMIDASGDVKSVLLFSRLGYGLDEEAVRAVAKMKFQPATQSGVPVPFWLRLAVEFQLR